MCSHVSSMINIKVLECVFCAENRCFFYQSLKKKKKKVQGLDFYFLHEINTFNVFSEDTISDRKLKVLLSPQIIGSFLLSRCIYDTISDPIGA